MPEEKALPLPRVELVHLHDGALLHTVLDDPRTVLLCVVDALMMVAHRSGDDGAFLEVVQCRSLLLRQCDKLTPEGVQLMVDEWQRFNTRAWQPLEGEIPF